MTMPNWTDPRPGWDERDAVFTRRKAELSMYETVAKTMDHAPTMEAVSALVTNAGSAEDAYVAARRRLDEAVAARDEAWREGNRVQLLHSLGTLDEKEAVKQHHALVVAEARFRFLESKIPALVASVNGTRERLSHATSGPSDRVVLEETRDFSKRLLESRTTRSAFTAAEDCGRRSNAEKAVWFPLAETIVRGEFASALAERRAEVANIVRDHRREDPYLPAEQDLEACFARRREALEIERRRVEAQIAAMNGHLQSLGGV